MDLYLFLLAFTLFWEMSTCIQCFACEAQRSDTNKLPLCEGFDYSAQFIADCPKSTGCVKKETRLISLGVTTSTVERGCAAQTMDGYQEKINGHWTHVTKIHEVYEEECKEDSKEFGKSTQATHCFCRGDLCNKSEIMRSGLALVAALVLLLVTS
ncbi:uncharacterized protein LOC126376078 [Pectinophora gossypiella]|uniref:uncharacterized protein LOC126376078 n=1 Tax=Pectinophora gossypiella TaxID=13191 RepID=UPI00214F2649|nr:uncharacterized protein LOC126376078 [Pectinophora gossypiella]